MIPLNPPGEIEYLNPTSPRLGRELFVPKVGPLQGKWIAFVSNGWASFAKIGLRMGSVLKERYGIAGLRFYSVPTQPAPPAEVLDRIAAECSGAVVGLAN